MNDLESFMQSVEVKRRREYYKAIKPYVDAKAEIYTHSEIEVIIKDDGSVMYEHQFSDTQKKYLRLIDEMIDHLQSRYFKIEGRA